MEEHRKLDSPVDNVSQGLIRNNDNSIKMYGLKQFCKRFCIDYEKQSKGIWLVDYLFTGLSNVHRLGNEFLKVAESAFILLGAHSGVWDASSNCSLGGLVISHPLRRLSLEQNMILARTLDKLCAAAPKNELTDSLAEQSIFIQDVAQQQKINALTAFMQLICSILELAPQNIKILKPKPLRLSLQVKEPLEFNNPYMAKTPLWKKQFGRVTIEWEYAVCEPESDVKAPESAVRMSENAVKTSKSDFYSASPYLGIYFCDYVNNQAMRLMEIAGSDVELGEGFIHDTRVVFRSFLSLLDSFKPYLDNKWKKSMLGKIRPAFKLLGKVRNKDIILRHLKEYVDSNQAAVKDMTFFAEQIKNSREAALSAASKYVLSPSYQSLLEELRGVIRSIACLPIIDIKYNAVPFRMDEIMPAVVGETSLFLFAYDEWLHGCYVSEGLLHRMRVSFKRLRYLLEFFRGPFGNELKKAIQICKQCQELLGAMQDNYVAGVFATQFLASLPQEEQYNVISTNIKDYIAYCSRETITCAGRFLDYWSEKGKKELYSQIRSINRLGAGNNTR